MRQTYPSLSSSTAKSWHAELSNISQISSFFATILIEGLKISHQYHYISFPISFLDLNVLSREFTWDREKQQVFMTAKEKALLERMTPDPAGDGVGHVVCVQRDTLLPCPSLPTVLRRAGPAPHPGTTVVPILPAGGNRWVYPEVVRVEELALCPLYAMW